MQRVKTEFAERMLTIKGVTVKVVVGIKKTQIIGDLR